MRKELNVEGNDNGIISSEAVMSAMTAVLNGEAIDYTTINVLLVSDEEIQKVNNKYLGHDYSTDVLTFPLHEGSDPIEGEIYVSLQTTKKNANEYGNTHRNEILRVVIHGILHLIGYDDTDSELGDKMKIKEDQYLKTAEEHYSLVQN